MSAPAVFRTCRITRVRNFLLMALVIGVMIYAMTVRIVGGQSLDTIEAPLLFTLMAVILAWTGYCDNKRTALEEVHVGRDAVSAFFRDGRAIIAGRANRAIFTEYRDCVSVSFEAFGRAQILKLEKWRFSPKTWSSLLAEIRQVLNGGLPGGTL